MTKIEASKKEMHEWMVSVVREALGIIRDPNKFEKDPFMQAATVLHSVRTLEKIPFLPQGMYDETRSVIGQALERYGPDGPQRDPLINNELCVVAEKHKLRLSHQIIKASRRHLTNHLGTRTIQILSDPRLIHSEGMLAVLEAIRDSHLPGPARQTLCRSLSIVWKTFGPGGSRESLDITNTIRSIVGHHTLQLDLPADSAQRTLFDEGDT